jgi:hypothetical protein
MKKIRNLAVLCAIVILMFSLTTVAYAVDVEDGTNVSEETNDLKPFTLTGTATVIDNATSGDGKEFFTIITPDKKVFYLIIDRQREQENVYFLDTVSEKDLLFLAEKSGDTGDGKNTAPGSEPESTAKTTPMPAASAETPSKQGHTVNTGILLMVLAVVLFGGGIGYYFKIYRPKHRQADSEDDLDYDSENDSDDSQDSEQSDDRPPWEDDDGDDEV